jgi:ornithine cyclodeaminase/alanine dehydrogenase-like protein (mu-crystallin family)
MPLLLTNQDIRQVLGMPDCLAALEAAYRQRAEGAVVGGTTRVETVLPLACPERTYEFTSMEGAVPAEDMMALRVNSNHWVRAATNGSERPVRRPDAPGGRHMGLIFLFSLEELRLVGILQDRYISVMRVGATSALAARCLARPDACTVGLLGAGEQARTQLLGLAAVFTLDEVRVFSPTPQRRETFAHAMESELGLPVSAVAEPRQAVLGADIVAAATNSPRPVFELDWLEPGQHVGAIQSSEIPPAIYERAEVVAVNVRAGFGRGAAGRYDSSANWEDYPALDQILTGRQLGRTDSRQISFFLNAGVGFQFAAVGARALAAARLSGLGVDLPDELFLQSWHT